MTIRVYKEISSEVEMSKNMTDFLKRMHKIGGNNRFEIQDVLEWVGVSRDNKNGAAVPGVEEEAENILKQFGEIVFQFTEY